MLTPDAGLFGDITNELADVAAAASGGSAAQTHAQVAAFEQLVGTIAPALDQIYDALTDDTASSIIDLALELGDAHITTFSGDMYDFNASGEFILAKSTNPGDTFQVQVRLQPYQGSASGTVITMAAAMVGTDRITLRDQPHRHGLGERHRRDPDRRPDRPADRRHAHPVRQQRLRDFLEHRRGAGGRQ